MGNCFYVKITSQVSLQGLPVHGRGFTCEAFFYRGGSELVRELILLYLFTREIAEVECTRALLPFLPRERLVASQKWGCQEAGTFQTRIVVFLILYLNIPRWQKVKELMDALTAHKRANGVKSSTKDRTYRDYVRSLRSESARAVKHADSDGDSDNEGDSFLALLQLPEMDQNDASDSVASKVK